MKGKLSTKNDRRVRRQKRGRARMTGTAEKPRLNVFRSSRYVFVQLIDDEKGKTMASVHSKSIKTGDAGKRKGKTAIAYLTGKALAEKAKTLNVITVVFDRAGFRYQGRVQAVAEGARDNGLKF
jgi:large subunit ribosomal protein L18